MYRSGDYQKERWVEFKVRPKRILLIYACAPFNTTLSYQNVWPQQFSADHRFKCTHINLAPPSALAKVRALLTARTWTGDAIVMLHSVFSNGCMLEGRLFDAICDLKQPRAFFIGNEYKFMPEKMRFCEELGVSLLVTQSNEPIVHSRYHERLGCSITTLPNAGFDSELFKPATPYSERPIDLGYRAFDSPWYIGHRERHDIAEYFTSHAERLGLTVDISLDANCRFAEQEWASFLNRCRGQLGTEAGGDYFDLTDATRIAVNAYMEQKPEASFGEIHGRFFDGKPTDVPMRVLTSRNIEAAGTRTVQLLFEGRYGDYLQPDVHYIPLKKDFSNVEEVLRKFRDDAFTEEVADNALRLVNEQFTYEHLIGGFADALEPLI